MYHDVTGAGVGGAVEGFLVEGAVAVRVGAAAEVWGVAAGRRGRGFAGAAGFVGEAAVVGAAVGLDGPGGAEVDDGGLTSGGVADGFGDNEGRDTVGGAVTRAGWASGGSVSQA